MTINRNRIRFTGYLKVMRSRLAPFLRRHAAVALTGFVLLSAYGGSAYAQAVPAAPANLSATPYDQRVILFWDNPNDASINKYQYSIDSGSSFTDITGSNASTIAYTVTGLTKWTSYTLAIRAVSSGGSGAFSSVTATPVGADCENGVTITDAQNKSGLVADCKKLVSIQGTLEGTTGNLDWADFTKDVDDWEGIIVSGMPPRIASINLDNKQLNGSIPSSISSLSNLSTLSLSYNSLSGSIPSSIGNLSNLISLSIDSNDLSGFIPSAFGNLSNLILFNASYNDLSGSIPSSIGNLDNLRYLHLNSNSLRGSIPSSIGNLSNLIDLYLWNNNLHSLVPSNIGDLSNLVLLNLANNRLTGSIPSKLGDLSNLQRFYIQGNKITSSVPNSAGDLPSLRYLYIDMKENSTYSIVRRSGTGTFTLSGQDGNDFTVSNSGLVRFKYTPNYESPRDSDTDNEYRAFVNASDVIGALSLIVNVTNVNESTPPSRPSTPTGLMATPNDQQLTLFWTNPGNATISKYQYSTNGGSNFTDITGSTASTVSHTVTGLSNGTAYTLAIRAVNSVGNSGIATVTATPIIPVPNAPANLSATPDNQQVILSWNNPGNTTISKYQYSTNGGSSFTDITGSTASTISYTVTGLTNGTSYTLAVRAVNASGNGTFSSVIATPSIPPVPNAPANLSATPDNQQVILSWNNPGNATISKYQYSTNGGSSFTDITGSTASTVSHTVTGLTNGTAYTLAIRAVNSTGPGAFSSITSTPAIPPVPSAPANLSATPDNQQVILSWNNPGNATISKYQYSTNGGSSFTDITGSTASTVSHTVTGLTNGTAYTLAIRAVNSTGPGTFSSVIATPSIPPVPVAPANLSATPDNQQVILFWTNPGNATIIKYQYSTNGGSSFTDITGSSASTISYTVIGLTNGTAYTLAIRAVNSTGPGAFSSVTSTPAIPPVPVAPANLSATLDNQQVILFWTNPGNATISKYQYSTNGGSSFTDITGSSASTISYTVTGLTNGTAYTLAIRAVNSTGPGAFSSVTATPSIPPVPAAPANLTATPGNRQVILSWTDPGNATITKYRYSKNGGSNFSDNNGSDRDTTSYTVTGLTNGTNYTFALRAVNNSGEGSFAIVNSTPIPPVPSAPANLTATPDNQQLILSWTDPGNATISGYQVSSDGGSNFTAITGSSASTTSYTVTDLTNGSSYTLAVRAVNSTGIGAFSSVTATPAIPPVPAAPANLTAKAGDQQLILSWTDPGNATISKYQYSTDGGEAFTDITGSGSSTTSYTVTGLINGTEYTLAIRAVNSTGNGVFSSVTATPVRPNKRPKADAGPDQFNVIEGAMVTLDGSGSSDPERDRLQYRWSQIDGEYMELSSSKEVNPTFLAPQGLTEDAVFSFRLRVTDSGDLSNSDTVTITVKAAAKPAEWHGRGGQDGQDNLTYYFPHLAVGAGWQTTLTYINYSPQEVTCITDFFADNGDFLTISFEDIGMVDSRIDKLPPGGSVHQETNVDLSTPLAPGWARASCTGPLMASLLLRQYEDGGVMDEVNVNAATVPATRFVTFAEQGEGMAGTGVAFANPYDISIQVTFTAKDAEGQTLASVDITLLPGSHDALNMAPLFGLSSFSGSLEITAMEPIISLSINAEAAPLFSFLPSGELDAAAQGPTTYYFPHLAVGAGWQTTITYINYSPQEVSCQTDFLSDHGNSLLIPFADIGMVDSRIDVLPPGGAVHEETNVELSAPLAPGWAKAACSEPVKASLLYRWRNSEGIPIAEGGVNAATVPATRFVTFAEQGEGKSGTGVAYANPSATAALITFTAIDASGKTLAVVDKTLLSGGHETQSMASLFGLSSFTGSLEITSTEPIVSLSLNFETAPSFSSLPPGEMDTANTLISHAASN